MKNSVFIKNILPFVLWFVGIILLTMAVDYALHRMQLVWVGRYLGYAGTFLILISFRYSLRKRKIIQSCSPKQLLLAHEYLSWAGALLIFVHAGVHFNALLPWLATFMMLVVVASGLVGKYLLKQSNESLRDRKQLLASEGLSEAEIENRLFWDTTSVDLMKNWRTVHMPITILLGVLSIVHIFSIFLFSK